MQHCPSFMFDVAVARAAGEFLSSELSLDAFSKKYFEAFSERFIEISQDDIHGAAEEMLQFLADIEAGENAVDLLFSFAYFRVYFDGPNRPRKLKPLFGTAEDAVKTKEWSKTALQKLFVRLCLALDLAPCQMHPWVGYWKKKKRHRYSRNWPLKSSL